MPFASKITLIPRGMTTFDDAFMYGVEKFSATSLYKTAIAGGPSDKGPVTFAVLMQLIAAPSGTQDLISKYETTPVSGWELRLSGTAFQTNMVAASANAYVSSSNRTVGGDDVGRLFLVVGFLPANYDPKTWHDKSLLTGTSPHVPFDYVPATAAAQVIGGNDANTFPASTSVRIFGTMVCKGALSVEQVQKLYDDVRTNNGFAGVTITNPAPVDDATITALTPFTWMRADSFNEAGGKVTEFVDKVDAAHLYVQATAANQVVTPTPNARMNNQLGAQFVVGNATRYVSNKTLADWKFMHDGTAVEGFVVISGGVDNGGILGTSYYNALGYQLNKNNTDGYWGIRSTVVQGSESIIFHRIGDGVIHFRHGSKKPVIATLDGFGLGDGPTGQTYNAAAAQNPLVIGANNTIGSNAITMNILDVLIFKRHLSDAERLTVHNYLQERYRHYGWASDVVTTDVKSVLAAKLIDAPDKQNAPKTLPSADPDETYTLTGPGARIGRVDPTLPRVWSYEATPIFRGLKQYSDIDYYVGPSGTLGNNSTGFVVSTLIRLKYPTGGHFLSCKSAAGTGWSIQVSAQYLYFSINGAAPGYSAVPQWGMAVLTCRYNPGNGRSEIYINGVAGNPTSVSVPAVDAGPPMIGRGGSLVNVWGSAAEVYGVHYGVGVPTLAQIQAQLVAIKTTERMQPIEGLTNNTLIDITQDFADNGGLLPDTLTDRMGTVNFTRVGNPQIADNYTRYFSW